MSRSYQPGLAPLPISVIREHKRVRLAPQLPASPVAVVGCPPLVVQAGKRGRFGGGKRFLLSPTQRAHLFGDPCYVPERLGCGGFACVYTHPDGKRVVKVTGDRYDALASQAVRENYGLAVPKELLAIHEVRNLIRLRTARQRPIRSGPYFSIVLDRAVRPGPSAAKIQRCYDKRFWPSLLVTCREMRAQCPEAAEAVCTYRDAIVRARDALSAAGVEWRDHHRGNLMHKDGDWVAVDYGFSTINADPMPPENLAGLRRPRWRGWR